MKLKNQIINYFVCPSKNGNPRIFTSPATMGSDVAKTIIEKQLKDSKATPLECKKLLHIAYDLDSQQLYMLNSSLFTKEEIIPLLQFTKIKISKDYGGYSNNPIIQGSPYSLIRIRTVSCFNFVKQSIDKISKGKEFVDLPVLEVNLNRTPSSYKWLSDNFKNSNYVGGLIGSEVGKEVPFFDEINLQGQKNPTRKTIYIQQTPFILINTALEASDNITEKEWAVLSGYRNYLYKEAKESTDTEEKKIATDFNSYVDLFSIKRHLYWGSSFEDFCKIFLNVDNISKLGDLIASIKRLMYATKTLEQEGYDSPSKHPYYMTFKIDNKFPLNLNSIRYEGKINPALQVPEFKIIDFDETSNFIIIESPAFIPVDTIRKVLKSINQPLVTHYNDAANTFDVKSGENSFKEYRQEKKQLGKIKALLSYDLRKNNIPTEKIQFRSDARATESGENPNICYQRKLSEYYYACDTIKELCKQRGVEFKDLIVLVGPIEKIFGSGTKGGFMGAKEFKMSNLKWPYEIESGLFVSPPLIAVSTSIMPSPAEQTETLIHEYAHNIYSITNPTHEPLYNKEKGLREKDPMKWWELYLSDPDERQAHKEQIKHNLLSGLSVDEIIRNKISKFNRDFNTDREGIGGSIAMDNYQQNYPLALKMKELVEEAKKELEMEEEQNEQPE